VTYVTREIPPPPPPPPPLTKAELEALSPAERAYLDKFGSIAGRVPPARDNGEPRSRGPSDHAESEATADEESRRSFPGLSHAEALARKVPATAELVREIIEAGTVGQVAGLPETHKSFLATEIAHKVAAGGLVLGRFKVLRCGPVGYWWQDDSEANELRRLQAYANQHGFTGELPLHWHLNEGLVLPNDIPALRAEIEREKQELVVLDSLYNFIRGRNLKEEEVAEVLAELKASVCDATGATVLTVDHSPWPSENNRGQRRAYGSVFKAAAVRCVIHIERDGSKLWIEAHGNNLPGLKRTLAEWDADTLELRLIGEEEGDLKAPPSEIAAFVTERGGKATPAEIRDHFDIADGTLRERRAGLEELGVRYERDGRGSHYVVNADNDDPAPRNPALLRGDALRGQKPHGYAELTPHPADPAIAPLWGSENADLQGKSPPRDPAIPTGSALSVRADPEANENELERLRAKHADIAEGQA